MISLGSFLSSLGFRRRNRFQHNFSILAFVVFVERCLKREYVQKNVIRLREAAKISSFPLRPYPPPLTPRA